MKKITGKLITLLVAAFMLLPMFTVQASAESSVIISCKDNIKGGDTFNVSVTFDGSDIGRVDAGLTYDTDKLTYISGGSSQGNSGYVQLKMGGTGEAITFNLKFQALEDGEATVSVETYEMYNLDENYLADTPSETKIIKIKGSAKEDQIVKQETSPDAPEKPTELKGADEIDEGSDNNITMILIISAAVLVLLIVIISILLAKRRKY